MEPKQRPINKDGVALPPPPRAASKVGKLLHRNRNKVWRKVRTVAGGRPRPLMTSRRTAAMPVLKAGIMGNQWPEVDNGLNDRAPSRSTRDNAGPVLIISGATPNYDPTKKEHKKSYFPKLYRLYLNL
ncbi:hypothetical protein J6590_036013 [Homalodisca vitripennis]|nr:hypothetical protein J6590_036013 [Homalodisca vitripennis]